MLISRGDVLVFVKHPISAFFLFMCAVLILAQIYVRLKKPKIVAGLPDIDHVGDTKAAAPAE
jgi:putative tricarboxylic transport membrane protein